jgi:hypothetical protein
MAGNFCQARLWPFFNAGGEHQIPFVRCFETIQKVCQREHLANPSHFSGYEIYLKIGMGESCQDLLISIGQRSHRFDSRDRLLPLSIGQVLVDLFEDTQNS